MIHECLLVSALMYHSESTVWKDKGKSRIKPVQMDNTRRLLGIGRLDRMSNEEASVVRDEEGVGWKD